MRNKKESSKQKIIPVFSKSEINFLEKLKEEYYHFAGLPIPNKNSKDIVNFGYFFPSDNPRFVIHIMDKWVSWKDRKLDKLLEGTDAYADVFGRRGFTFDEFKFVLSGRVKESSFSRFRIFDYLYLTDQTDRDFFMVSNTDDEEVVLNSYVKAILESIKLEIPLLDKFFTSAIPLFFDTDALKRHVYLLAQSGAGKSEMLKVIWYDLQRRSQKTRDKTLLLMEPHADMCLEVLQFSLNKNPKYFNRIVYLDPFIRQTAQELFGYDLLGADFSFTINPFDIEKNCTNQEINWMTQELAGAFFSILQSHETTQMEALIETCIEVLLRRENSSIADLKRFMDNNDNQDLVDFGLTIPNEERQKMMDKIRIDKKLHPTQSGIFYRLQSLIGDSEFKKLLVGNSSVNLEKEMNSGKVIIFNLSKSKLGPKTAPAFSKLMVALIQGIVTKRQAIPKEKRKNTFVFLDEFQNYITEKIKGIMSESRKFALHTILSHQVYGQQMDTDMRRIVTGNTSLKLAGENGADSIKFMSEQMGNLRPNDFEKLPKYAFYCYNKQNKKSGFQTVRVPDFLVKQQQPFYMNKEELKKLFLWLVYESGYYKKVIPKVAKPKDTTPLVIKSLEKKKKSSPKKDTPNTPIYNVNFEEE